MMQTWRVDYTMREYGVIYGSGGSMEVVAHDATEAVERAQAELPDDADVTDVESVGFAGEESE